MVKLDSYIPNPDDIDPSAVMDARHRLGLIIQQYWPEIDTRPNSVFGDLHQTPLALLLSALEQGMMGFMSDLDLSNVARGLIHNETFVRAYLANFGVSNRVAVAATGVIRLAFSSDGDYPVGLDAVFTFGAQAFQLRREEENPLMINRTGYHGARVLTQTGQSRFEVFIPVVGPPGSLVNDGDVATHNLDIPELLNVTATGDFDSGIQVDTLPQMAVKAQRNFASANLTSRSGIISFMGLYFPQIMGVSATITGDREMIRAGHNPLGVLEGAVDVFIRSRNTYVRGQASLPLTYDMNETAWVGRVALPVIPAFMDLSAGVFQAGNFENDRGVNRIYSQSAHPYLDNIGLAYSRYETLGLKITDTTPGDFKPSYISDVRSLVSNGSTLQVTGEYASDVFNSSSGRYIVIRFDSVTEFDGLPAVMANVRDAQTGETATLIFVANTTVAPSMAQMVKTDTAGVLLPGYRQMARGLEMTFRPLSGVFDPQEAIGFTYEVLFSGRSAHFIFNYLYDPFIVQADAVVQSTDNKPVNVSVLTRSCIVCHITNFAVNYRLPFGAKLDTVNARAYISNYVNSLVYPQTYDETRIGIILRSLGGASLQSITKQGKFYPSLGQTYVDKTGKEVNIPRFHTTTLIPPVNDLGFGVRNVTYILDPATITFNATII